MYRMYDAGKFQDTNNVKLGSPTLLVYGLFFFFFENWAAQVAGECAIV